MEFYLGTGLLMVSMVHFLAAASFTGREEESWLARFMTSEFTALVITTTAAFGISFAVAGAAEQQTPILATAAIVGVAVATALLWRRMNSRTVRSQSAIVR